MFRLEYSLDKPLLSNIQLFKSPSITLYNNSVRRTDANLQTNNQAELETNPCGCPWQQQDLGFSSLLGEAALIYSHTKDLRLLGKMGIRNSVSSEELDVSIHMNIHPCEWRFDNAASWNFIAFSGGFDIL